MNTGMTWTTKRLYNSEKFYHAVEESFGISWESLIECK